MPLSVPLNVSRDAKPWQQVRRREEAWKSGFQLWQERKLREAGARVLKDPSQRAAKRFESHGNSGENEKSGQKIRSKAACDLDGAQLLSDGEQDEDLQLPCNIETPPCNDPELNWKFHWLQSLEAKRLGASAPDLRIATTSDSVISHSKKSGRGACSSELQRSRRSPGSIQELRMELAIERQRLQDMEEEAERIRRHNTDRKAQEEADRLWAALRIADIRQHKINVTLINANPHNVFFINPTIIDRFSCGRRVESTIQDLASGCTSVSDIPTIRVVRRQGKLLTLDHRRLHAFRMALPAEAQVPMKLIQSELLVDQYVPAHCPCYTTVHIVRTRCEDRAVFCSRKRLQKACNYCRQRRASLKQ